MCPLPFPPPSLPVHVLEAALLGTGVATQQHHNTATLGRDEPQQGSDLLTASPDQVVDSETVEGGGRGRGVEGEGWGGREGE